MFDRDVVDGSKVLWSCLLCSFVILLIEWEDKFCNISSSEKKVFSNLLASIIMLK